MKISRNKIGILIIFVIVILIESISFATYQTITLEDVKNNTIKEMKANIEKEKVFLTEEEQETLNFINEYRRKNGLEKLQPFSKLQEVSKIKAKDLVEYEYFSHTSNQLGTPFEMLQQNGIDYRIAGENLAGNLNPERAVEAWINSPSHRENILEEEFQYTGICVMDSPVYGRVFVQLFIGM